jgi:hypothetical protein
MVQVQDSFSKTKTQINLINFYFEFVNIHVSHLTQLGIIKSFYNIKTQTYVKTFTIFIII